MMVLCEFLIFALAAARSLKTSANPEQEFLRLLVDTHGSEVREALGNPDLFDKAQSALLTLDTRKLSLDAVAVFASYLARVSADLNHQSPLLQTFCRSLNSGIFVWQDMSIVKKCLLHALAYQRRLDANIMPAMDEFLSNVFGVPITLRTKRELSLFALLRFLFLTKEFDLHAFMPDQETKLSPLFVAMMDSFLEEIIRSFKRKITPEPCWNRLNDAMKAVSLDQRFPATQALITVHGNLKYGLLNCVETDVIRFVRSQRGSLREDLILKSRILFEDEVRSEEDRASLTALALAQLRRKAENRRI